MNKISSSSAIVIGFLCSLAAAQSYSVSAIGNGSPRAVDGNGNAAGIYAYSRKPPQERACYWSRSSGFEDLGTLGGDDSAAFGLNGAGQVVGQANSSAGAMDQAFLWTQSAGMIDLGTLGGASSSANAINAAGEVAGESDLADGFAHAFLWTQSGGMQDLGTLHGGQQSGANAINSSGEVAGWASSGNNSTAITWSPDAGMVDLGIAASCGSTGFAINDSSEVAGWFNNSASCGLYTHGFSWTQGGGFIDLGVLPGGQYSFAYGINAAGQIVGTGQSSATSNVAILWTADGKIHDLNTLISSKSLRKLTSANAINNAGQIVVDATTTSGTGQYALILTPIMQTTLASSVNPSTLGQSVTFTATVSSIAGGPPDGEQVTFKSGTITLGVTSLSGGIATFTTSGLSIGTHKIQALYAGDSIYAASKSALLSQTVNK